MRILKSVIFGCGALLFVLSVWPQHVTADNASLVVRGRYLVTQAGKCADCHGVGLHGMFLGFIRPGLPVNYHAPRIAGLPQLSTAAAVKFLQTGLLPDGKHADPPMPQYRFNNDDAQAITAYLKSLK